MKLENRRNAMKNAALRLLAIATLAGCSTSSTNDRMANTADTPAVQSSGGENVMRFAAQSWDRGVHFCTYTDGLSKVIKQVERFETCPSEITEKQ
jgi:hypothetical protein